MRDQCYVVFDCEAIGLHGETFAVGVVVISSDGHLYQEELYACDPARAAGTDEDRAWVTEHCPVIPTKCGSPSGVRRQFWKLWLKWHTLEAALLVADCGWPVETRFLAACVDDDPEPRTWTGPFPLHDVASWMAAAGMDPMARYEREAREPEHHPLGDARCSARRLLQARAVLEMPWRPSWRRNQPRVQACLPIVEPPGVV